MEDKPLTDDQKKRVSDALRSDEVAKMIGMELVEMAPGEATISIEMSDKLRQRHGVLHGGITATLIDTAMAFAVITRLGEAEKATTIDLTIHYLRPHTEGAVTCKARVLRVGKRIMTLSADAFNAQNNLIATAVSTYTKI